MSKEWKERMNTQVNVLEVEEGDKNSVTHMLVFAVEVSHSPANPMMSSPVDSWLKNLG